MRVDMNVCMYVDVYIVHKQRARTWTVSTPSSSSSPYTHSEWL